MPTYEYLCTKCEHEFEISQPMSAKTLTVCPKELCPLKPWGKGKVKKMIGAGAGLIFKGSGFYITDYRSENYKDAAKKESGAAEKGKESKPAETSAKESTTPKPKTEPKASESKASSKKE